MGADRIAANGDVANKIGTYAAAVLARHHGIPFYVAAPCSTIAPEAPEGDGIPIEERPACKVTHVGGRRLVPEGVQALNIAFDVTPRQLVSALVTEVGVAAPVDRAAISALLAEETGPGAKRAAP